MKDEAGSQELGVRMGGKARSSEQKQEAASRSSLLAPKEGAEMKQDPKQAKNEKADEPSDNSPSTLPASGSKERSPAKFFTDLEVWQKAHAFVLDVYQLTTKFPSEERFGLANQFRRAAVSIPANIAEGFRKYTAADKARFMNIAEGSLEECRYYCILAQDLGYGNTSKLQEALEGIAGQLAAYIHRLRGK